MPPFIKFLDSARRLIPMGMTRQQIFNFAKQEFGDVNELMRKQINNLFKPKKPIGKKDPDFDNTVEKMVFDDEGKPFNPRNPLKKADGGIMRAGFSSGGDYKMRIQEKAEEIAEENYGKDFYDLSGSMQSKIYERAIREIEDMFADQADMMRKGEADGGRIGLKQGEGIMKMASVDEPFYRDSEADRDDHSFRMFKKPYKELNEFELEEFQEEMMRLMNKFSAREKENMKMASYGYDDAMGESFEEFLRLKKLKEIPEDMEFDEYLDQLDIDIPYSKKDRGAPSITLADGGRAAFKDGVLKRGLKAITDTDTYKTLEDRGFNTAVGLKYAFDEIFNLLSGIPFADGGRAAFKDGPKDPKRRTFMRAAAGIASMLPFGGAKLIGKAAPVVAKAAEITGPALAKIVETVMSLGKLVSVKGRRVKEMVTKKKHEGVEVTEDVADQSYTIKKGGKEIYYKPGRQDETGGFDDDIIEVIEKTVTKKAGGGIAGMLGE